VARIVGFVQGGKRQCCTERGELGQSEKMENIRQEAELRDGADGFDGVWVDRGVV